MREQVVTAVIVGMAAVLLATAGYEIAVAVVR